MMTSNIALLFVHTTRYSGSLDNEVSDMLRVDNMLCVIDSIGAIFVSLSLLFGRSYNVFYFFFSSFISSSSLSCSSHFHFYTFTKIRDRSTTCITVGGICAVFFICATSHAITHK